MSERELVEGEVAPTPVPAPTPPTPSITLIPRPVPVPVPVRRAKLAISKESRTVSTAALTQLEKTLGSRAALVDALALGTTADGVDTARADYVLGLLADPKHASKSLRWIARVAGITLQELLTLYRKASVQRAHLQSMAHVSVSLPGVVKDIMDKSIPYELNCYACGGLGQVTPEPTTKERNPIAGPCHTCKGSGRLQHEPDLERQKLALALGGLLKGGGGVTVNVQQQQGQAGGIPLSAGEGLLHFQRSTDQALYGPDEDV